KRRLLSVCNGDEYLKLSVQEMVQAVQSNAGSERAECSDPPTAVRGFPVTNQTKVSSQIEAGNSLGQTGSCSYNPGCHWAESSQLNMKTLRFTSGATLQVKAIPTGILDKVDMFYCCTSCGKVFWEGSHFSRVVSQFQEALHITDGTTFYHL
ncbi:hypothetical protein scyTo_0020215, partial [Scyliorhinus torazame]|nr:hypothetical protein [Scyliorhinus torazame]